MTLRAKGATTVALLCSKTAPRSRTKVAPRYLVANHVTVAREKTAVVSDVALTHPTNVCAFASVAGTVPTSPNVDELRRVELPV